MNYGTVRHWKPFPADDLAGACAAHEDALAELGRERDEAVDFQLRLFQATNPEKFVFDWIADPTADLVEMYRCLIVHGDDEAALGAAVKRAMLNRMREAAEHSVE